MTEGTAMAPWNGHNQPHPFHRRKWGEDGKGGEGKKGKRMKEKKNGRKDEGMTAKRRV